MKTSRAIAYGLVGSGFTLIAQATPWYISLGVLVVMVVIVAVVELALHVFNPPVKDAEGDEDDTQVEALAMLREAQREGEELADTALRLLQAASKWAAHEHEQTRRAAISFEQADGRTHRTGQIRRAVELALDDMPPPESGVYERVCDDDDDRKTTEIEDDGATTVFVRPQPPPQNALGPAIWPMIAEELEEAAQHATSPVLTLVANDARMRHEDGMAKYGVPLVAENGRDHLVDAYQEALDGSVYLRAEYERGTKAAIGLFVKMKNLAVEIRGVLYERDGR